MPTFLESGYEEAIRSKLGVKAGELGDEIINQRLIIDLAETTVLKRVENYSTVAEDEKIYLEGAIISYACHLLAPSMGRRLNQKVSTIDVKWEKGRVDWNALSELFLAEVESYLTAITSVEVDAGTDHILFDKSRHERQPLV